ncbi:MAG: undecaprenyl-diphosphate phosphatase [Bdellovibrionota bacterium]
MNELLLAFILGIIEGLTEFLPVSSTAHLRIAQSYLGIPLEDEFWKLFAIVIQLGAVISVLFYFKARILAVLKGQQKLLLIKLAIAFSATVVPVLFLRKLASHNLESLNIISLALIIGGIVMIIIDKLPQKAMTIESLDHKQSAFIGLFQALAAIFPGVSRSMATIVGGQVLGLSRKEAVEFSFLLSIPTMLAATTYDLIQAYFQGPVLIQQLQERWDVLGMGMITSFIVALFVIAWFMKWVRTKSFVAFGVYRIIFGLYILLTHI